MASLTIRKTFVVLLFLGMAIPSLSRAENITFTIDKFSYPDNGPFVITLTSGLSFANQTVYIKQWKNGVFIGENTFGTTDANGSLTLTGNFNASLQGSWTEQARIGTTLSNPINFEVLSAMGASIDLSINKNNFLPGDPWTIIVSAPSSKGQTVFLQRWNRGGSNYLGEQQLGTIGANGTLVVSGVFSVSDKDSWAEKAKIGDSLSQAIYFAVSDTVGPAIASVVPSSGAAPLVLGQSGDMVTVYGSNFGSQGSGQVMFSSSCNAPNNLSGGGASLWTDTKIVTQVPWKATTGFLFVNLTSGITSNKIGFVVTTPCPTEPSGGSGGGGPTRGTGGDGVTPPSTTPPISTNPNAYAGVVDQAALQNFINSLLKQIADLQKQIAILASGGIGNIGGGINNVQSSSCQKFLLNIGTGQSGDEVVALKEVLTKEGFSVPSGNVFDTVTQSAVVGLQEKYSSEILAPSGLSQGTGYVGFRTRSWLNSRYGCGG